MPIVSLESAAEKNVSASILNFLTAYGVISLLSKYGGAKLKGDTCNSIVYVLYSDCPSLDISW